ncbi:hypothetical protein [Hathewaya massiliensis]|uniref:hypothetical protein n=1 Tax=Hathewaya massiliensis TaxID=1964382 RepID=UPI0011583A2D|nr:hypothetical protein [Hathewaya massiliensis]
MLDYLKINADTAIKILSIIITAITTYFVTKYTANRPRKLEIKDLQFKTVYLPIYKLLYNDLNKRINKDTALKYANEIKIILSNNFELAFP